MRWLVSGILLVLALMLLVLFTVPFSVSNDRLLDGIADEIAEITGHRVLLADNVEIAFLPVPTVTVQDLEITAHRAEDAEPLLVADEMTADFGLVSMLSGRPQFSNFRLRRPVLVVERLADGTTNWASQRGHIAESAAIAAHNARARQPGNDETEIALPMTPIGTLAVEDGTLRMLDAESGREAVLSDVDGTFSWPRLGMGARIDLNGVYRGETVRLTANAERPADLLGGNVAPLRLNLVSDLVSVSYGGTAGFNGTPVFAGRLNLSSPSVRRALQWSGADIKPGEAIGALALEANVHVAVPQLRMNDLVLEIDRNRGNGVLDINWPRGQKPTISGTLAYNTLDIGAFLGAFTPLPAEATTDIVRTIDTGFLRQLGLDLRLSAQSAQIGSVTLQNLGAAARIEEGRALFDIGDASAYGGNLMGRIAISQDGLRGGGEVQLSAQNMDFGAVYDAFGLRGPLPRGTGTMNLSLRSPRPTWATTLEHIQGTIELSIVNGRIPGVDLARFRELSRELRFFEIDQAAGDGVPFASAVLNATFAGGTAEVKKGEIVTNGAAIMLSGLVPYDRGSLAMSGAVTAPPPANGEAAAEPRPDAEPPLRFFIGGSWPTPVISPITQF